MIRKLSFPEKKGELTDDLSLLDIRFEPKQGIKEINVLREWKNISWN